MPNQERVNDGHRQKRERAPICCGESLQDSSPPPFPRISRAPRGFGVGEGPLAAASPLSQATQGEWRIALSTVEIIGAFLGQLVKCTRLTNCMADRVPDSVVSFGPPMRWA